MNKERIAPAALFVVSLAVYGATAPAWVLGGDSGEFITLMARGGVAHPPGYPLYVMLLRAFAWLPVPAAHAAALVSAGTGAFAIVAIHRACRVWGASPGATAVAAAALASSPLMWRLSSESDVFALNVLLAACFVAACGGPVPGWKRALRLGLLAGLGVSNHHSIVLLWPLAAWGLWRAARESTLVRAASACLAGIAIGLTPYVYLYWAARRMDPAVAWVWGDIHDFGTLINHMRRAEFGTTRLALRDAPLQPWLQLRTLAARLTTDSLGLPLFVLAAAAVWVRRPTLRGFALTASGVLAGPAFAAILNIAPEGVSANIVERFYLLPEALCSVVAALALDVLFPRLGARLRVSGAVAAGVLVAGFCLGASRVAEGHRPTIDMYVRNTLAAAQPHAILLGSGDQKFAGFLYGQRVLGLRTDVDFITPEMLPAPWYRRRESNALGTALSTPESGRVGLVSQLLETHRPVAFAGSVPAALVAAGFAIYPLGTVFVIDSPSARTPDLRTVEHENLELLASFQLEPVASASSSTWSGATFAEYARVWLALEAAFQKVGDAQRADACRTRALAFAPWMRIE